MATEDTVNVTRLGISESTRCYLGFQSKPAGVQAVQIARKRLIAMIELLYPRIKQLAHAADKGIVGDEAIELVSVDREMTLSLIFPDIALVHGNTDEVRHDLGETLIVVPFYPDDFDFALAVGELANLREEFPVIAIQTSEIQIGENIAEENQSTVAGGIENGESISRSTDIGTEMHV